MYAALERHYVAKNKNLEVIRESGYSRSRQGLGPWRPVLVVVTGVGRAVRGKSFSLLGPFGLPRWGGLPFLLSPHWGERLSSSPPHLGERSQPRSRHPIAPENGNSSESPWPSSWPSSPAPRGVPEPAAPLGGRPLGPLAMGPDRWSVRPSPASPVKHKGSLDPA